MYALWMLGQYLEPALGRARFVACTCCPPSAARSWCSCSPTPGTSGSWHQGVVGASGAVFGLFGAIARGAAPPRPRAPAGSSWSWLINAVIGFVVPSISWQAHLGGLVTGALVGAAYAYAPKARRRGGMRRRRRCVVLLVIRSLLVAAA